MGFGFGLGVSLILGAAGAVLLWAVDVEVSGVELSTVGAILLVVGIVGALLSLIIAGFSGRDEDVVARR